MSLYLLHFQFSLLLLFIFMHLMNSPALVACAVSVYALYPHGAGVHQDGTVHMSVKLPTFLVSLSWLLFVFCFYSLFVQLPEPHVNVPWSVAIAQWVISLTRTLVCGLWNLMKMKMAHYTLKLFPFIVLFVQHI